MTELITFLMPQNKAESAKGVCGDRSNRRSRFAVVGERAYDIVMMKTAADRVEMARLSF